MAVSDLTGTTWLINSTIVEPSSTIYAEINFASNADTFWRIAIYDGFEPGSEQLIRYTLQEPESSIIVYEYGWSNEAYRTIEITGGTDVTNSTLIGWLEDNARQIVDDVAIKYQGNTIATMNASGTKTLLTAESYCENNITIEYTKPSANLQAKTGIVPQTTSVTVTPDSGYDGLSSVQINAMPSGSASTPATSITVTPSISVSSGGLITATASASQNVTPTVSAGYVSSGTAGTVTVSGSNTSQLTTQAAQTITPTTTNQTIASGKYITGTQTILGDANLLAENIKKDVSIFNVVGTLEGGGGEDAFTWEEYSATPSSTTSITFSGVTKEPNVLGVYMRTDNYSYANAPSNCLFSLFLVKKGTAARPFYAVPIKRVNTTIINAGYTGSTSGNIMATACRVVFDDTLSTLTVKLNYSYLGNFDTSSTYYLAWIC